MGRSMRTPKVPGLPEGLLARLRLFWMVRRGPRLAEIQQQGKLVGRNVLWEGVSMCKLDLLILPKF